MVLFEIDKKLAYFYSMLASYIHNSFQTPSFLKTKGNVLLWLLVLFLGNTKLIAQAPYLKHLSFSEGLPSNTVYSIFQDKTGYLWFATDLGVCRYSGYEIEHYTPDNGVPDTEVFGFFQDSKDRIWFRTLNGKTGYYQRDSFFNEKNDTALAQIDLNSYISSIVEYQDHLYMGSMGGDLLHLSPDKKVLKQEVDALTISGVLVRDDHCYIINTQNILCYTLPDFQLQYRIRYPYATSYPRFCFLENSLLYATNKTLYFHHLQDTALNNKIDFNSEIIAVHEIDSSIWIGTRNGIYRIELKNRNRLTIQNYFLEGKAVTSVCKDFEGGLWFSTLTYGIYYTHNHNLKIQTTLDVTDQTGIVSAIGKTPFNNNWVTFAKNQYTLALEEQPKLHQLSRQKEHAVKNIRFLDDELWIMGGNTTKKSYRSANQKEHSPLYLTYSVKDILKEPNGNYLLATSSTLMRVTPHQMDSLLLKEEKKILQIPKECILLHQRTHKLHQDKQGQIWVGGNNGLYFLEGNAVKELTYQGKSLGAISDFCNYGHNKLIVTTLQEGTFLIENQQIKQKISRAQGLNSSSCLQCELGTSKLLWILTSKGLNSIALFPDTTIICDLSSRLGLNNEKIIGITTNSNNQQLLLATPKQILSYTALPALNNPPKLIIHPVRVNNQLATNKILRSIPYQSNVSISFTGISYKHHTDLYYQYKLIGASDQWITTNSRTLQFEGLSPNTYTLQVKAVNALGHSSKIQEITFSIQKPFYQEWWFYLLCGTFIALLIRMAWRIRIQKLKESHQIEQQIIIAQKEKAELERELHEIEQQALRLQMNPHFIFNALNTIKGYYSSKNISKANEYITKFSRLLRIILEHKERTISITKEKELLDLYLKLIMLRYDTEFSFVFEIDPNINPNETVIPSMLLQPFVENSIIHGIATMLKDGKIEVLFTQKKQHLQCIIRDNGIGRETARKRTFAKSNRVNSIDITKRRLKLIQQESGGHTSITINDLYQDQQPAGTEVILNLPYIEQW